MNQVTFYESLAIHTAIAVLRGAIKNPAKKAQLQGICEELRDDLNEEFPVITAA